jgi:hypothetical protein
LVVLCRVSLTPDAMPSISDRDAEQIDFGEPHASAGVNLSSIPTGIGS